MSANWKPAFLKELAGGLTISHAASAAGVTRQAAYKARGVDSDFADAWEHAILESTEALEAEARRRAQQGVQKVVVQKGQIVMVPVNAKGEVVPEESPDFVGMVPLIERVYSDRLMEVLLKGRNPETFGDKMKVQNDVSLRTPADGEAAADEILARVRRGFGVPSDN